jgi:hypothetical protein
MHKLLLFAQTAANPMAPAIQVLSTWYSRGGHRGCGPGGREYLCGARRLQHRTIVE